MIVEKTRRVILQCQHRLTLTYTALHKICSTKFNDYKHDTLYQHPFTAHACSMCSLTATDLVLCLNAVSGVQVQLPFCGGVCVDLGHELLQLHLLPRLELVGQREVQLTAVGLQGDAWGVGDGWGWRSNLN